MTSSTSNSEADEVTVKVTVRVTAIARVSQLAFMLHQIRLNDAPHWQAAVQLTPLSLWSIFAFSLIPMVLFLHFGFTKQEPNKWFRGGLSLRPSGNFSPSSRVVRHAGTQMVNPCVWKQTPRPYLPY